jgi:4-alpha-glucanotransferase
MGRRRAGVLLHPTSLPGGIGNGDLGTDAYRFVEFLANAGISLWQMLPIAPTHGDLSPYHALSVHAGNPLLICLDWLIGRGWLHAEKPPAHIEARGYRYQRLSEAWRGFQARANQHDREEFARFQRGQSHWLDDYALFQSLRKLHGGKSWLDWPAEFRDRAPKALARARKSLSEDIDRIRFEQFVFHCQWRELRQFASDRGVMLFGDMPIFVSHDSAEVWGHPEYFALDEAGQPLTVAGVPPDYFSATGQRWGNPHYRWERMEADGFKWWKARIATQLALFDWVRIDHFRGFESYWEIPVRSQTAIEGHWVKAPGEALFQSLQEAFDPLPLVAEDLGVITPEVESLRKQFRLPGMKILQFAFEGGPGNPYLPHNHRSDFIAYTGTHDNDTTVGWFNGLNPELQLRIRDYLGQNTEPMPWALIRCAMASVSQVAIIPLQDVLGLDGKHRMNTPGTINNNWTWRFSWDQVESTTAARLRHLVEMYGRFVN